MSKTCENLVLKIFKNLLANFLPSPVDLRTFLKNIKNVERFPLEDPLEKSEDRVPPPCWGRFNENPYAKLLFIILFLGKTSDPDSRLIKRHGLMTFGHVLKIIL